jgi:hypothetical protein
MLLPITPFRSALGLTREIAGAEHLVRLTSYVVDIEEYRANLKTLGQVYREVFGAHYPGPGGAAGREGCAGRDRGNGRGAALEAAFAGHCYSCNLLAGF